MEKTCLIIDDEPFARKRLSNLVDQIPELVLLDECKTGKEAISKIELLQPDLIFLDIQMKDMSGFDVLQKLNKEHRPLVIFVTAFDVYAVRAFEYFAFDYLLKPFKKERFLNSVSRVFAHFETKNNGKIDSKIDELLSYLNTTRDKVDKSLIREKIPIKSGNTVSFIDVSTIIYITASGSYIDIKTEDKTYVHRSSMNELMDRIESSELIRIHRSSIINLNSIQKVIHSNYGELDVKMNDGKLFRISKSYKQTFQNKLGL